MDRSKVWFYNNDFHPSLLHVLRQIFLKVTRVDYDTMLVLSSSMHSHVFDLRTEYRHREDIDPFVITGRTCCLNVFSLTSEHWSISRGHRPFVITGRRRYPVSFSLTSEQTVDAIETSFSYHHRSILPFGFPLERRSSIEVQSSKEAGGASLLYLAGAIDDLVASACFFLGSE